MFKQIIKTLNNIKLNLTSLNYVANNSCNKLVLNYYYFSNKKQLSQENYQCNKKYTNLQQNRNKLQEQDQKNQTVQINESKVNLNQSEEIKNQIRKINQMNFTQLIETNTNESLDLALKKLKQFEKKIDDNNIKQKELRNNLQFYQKREQQLLDKKQKLKQNLIEQQIEFNLMKIRAQRQILQSKQYAIKNIAKQLLQVADSIARCRKLAEQLYEKSNDTYVQKIVQSQKQMMKLFQNYHITQLDPLNQEYDANTQQSLVQIPCQEGHKSNTVAYVIQTGYLIHNRLLRSARVAVFK